VDWAAKWLSSSKIASPSGMSSLREMAPFTLPPLLLPLLPPVLLDVGPAPEPLLPADPGGLTTKGYRACSYV
jgi:hypothetical protein